MGRVEWLRDAGLSYKDLERRGFGFVVVEALVHYHSAAYFDDELVVCTELAEAGRVALRFGYEVLRNGERVASGHTRHACVRLPGGRPVRMPEEVRSLAGHSA